jgi:hypothetical protein
MTSKTPLVTVVEDLEDSLNHLQKFEKVQLSNDYDPKELLPTTFSSSEESELESGSDDDQELDLLDDENDPNETLNATEKKSDDEGSFRGRPSSCVFVASLAASLTDDELSMSVTKHFEKVSFNYDFRSCNHNTNNTAVGRVSIGQGLA